MNYYECPHCGANLDFGEKCDCQKEVTPLKNNPVNCFSVGLRSDSFGDENKPVKGLDRKEACTGGTAQTSVDTQGNNIYNNNSTESEVCQ